MWLLSKGRVKEAEAVVRRVARVNGKTLPDVIFDEGDIKEQMVGGTPVPDVKYMYLQALGRGTWNDVTRALSRSYMDSLFLFPAE